MQAGNALLGGRMGGEQPAQAAARQRIHDHHLRSFGMLFSGVHRNAAGVGVDPGQSTGERLGVARDFRTAAIGTEFARAQAVWQRKFGQPAPDAAGRARQMRFLLGRGFSAAVVRRAVQGAPDEEA